MIDLNKFEMVQKAARELFEAVQKNYYKFSDLKDLNYSEICEWCGWPETKKAKVYADSCYICFGVRFGTVKQYINTGE